MNKICNKCGNEFEAKRETARYCSDKCRIAHSRVSVTQSEVSVTKEVSVTPDVTLKEDSKTRLWLIEQFEAEGKSPDEIKSIMTAQDNYYQSRSYYFIPARMLSTRGMFGTQETTQKVNN